MLPTTKATKTKMMAPTTEERPDVFEQLRLALALISGRHSFMLTEREEWLLQLDKDYLGGEEIKIAAEEIIFEIVASLLPQPPTIDPKLIAVEFLHQIQRAGGRLLASQVALPSEFLSNLEEDGLIKRTFNGVVLGKNALKAIHDYEGEIGDANDEHDQQS